jgi:type IV pilus assembly protein PilA
MNFMKKTLKNGFTLVELMIVVAIITILSSITAPKFGKQIQKAKDAKALSLVGNWRSASTLYYTDNTGEYAENFGELAEYVGTQTQNQTFEEVGLSTKITTTSSAAGAYIQAGTSELEGNVVLINYSTTSTSASIDFDSTNGNNTSGDSWSDL